MQPSFQLNKGKFLIPTHNKQISNRYPMKMCYDNTRSNCTNRRISLPDYYMNPQIHWSNYMKQRFETLDTFRGIVIINMIAYHFLYDVFVIFGSNPFWYRNPGVHAWQQFICCSFIILSGFVWPYGKKKNLKRGIVINLLGFVITAFTLIFTPGQEVWFGILNFLGCAILLTFPLDMVMKKITQQPSSKGSANPVANKKSHPVFWAGLVISIVLFFLFRKVNNGYLGFDFFYLFNTNLCQLPEALYQSKVLIPFGFPTDSFYSSDYFSILPWFFLYAFGYFLGRIIETKEWFINLSHGRIPVLNWMGRKSIWIYMVHQVICYGLCMLIFK